MIVLIATSCTAPWSKESYLKQFDAFVSEVSENYKNYDEKDWKKKTEKYEKFSGVWYDKFKNDFTLKEQISIEAKKTKWHYYRYLGGTTSNVKQLLESLNIKGIKDQVQHYIDNNMQDDLQKFYDDAKKAGKDAQDAFTEILKDLQLTIDE